MSPKFNGAVYDPAQDDERLKKQMGRVFNLMADRKWRTLSEIERETGDPQSSVSAQLRHLRKPRFGGYCIERQTRGDRKRGLFEYRLLPPGSLVNTETRQKIKCVNEHADAARVVAWINDHCRLAPALAFTEGPERQIAYAIEQRFLHEN